MNAYRRAILETKSLVRRIAGVPDPWKRFRDFERRIHPETWDSQPSVLAAAAAAACSETPATCEQSNDAVVRRGAELRRKLLAAFAGRHERAAARLRVLIHVPGFDAAPAGYSLFRNLGQGLETLGVPTAFWPEGESIAPLLERFRPSLLLSVDHKWYPATQTISPMDLADVRAYRARNELLLGLSCNHFPREPARLQEQLAAARSLKVDFFYSFQCADFVRREYRPFFDAGFRVASCEFGANPLIFYPVSVERRDLSYVYLAATNFEKWGRLGDFLGPVLRDHPGLIVGPGWPRTTTTMVPDDQMRHLYARARVGLNLHVPFQIAAATELNERTYNLAACAVPQLLDNPALLPARFNPGSIYSAVSPAEYVALFGHILDHPAEARERGAASMEEVLARHTVFHRADALVEFVRTEVWGR